MLKRVLSVRSILQKPGETANQEIYNRYFRDLVRIAFLLTGDRGHAEDAVHDVFAKCWDRLDQLEEPRSYLTTAVLNRCRGQHRKIRRIELQSEVSVVELPGRWSIADQLDLIAALQALSYRKRAAVVLRYFEDLPEAAIAEHLGCRPSSVRSLIHRALRELKGALQ